MQVYATLSLHVLYKTLIWILIKYQLVFHKICAQYVGGGGVEILLWGRVSFIVAPPLFGEDNSNYIAVFPGGGGYSSTPDWCGV